MCHGEGHSARCLGSEAGKCHSLKTRERVWPRQAQSASQIRGICRDSRYVTVHYPGGCSGRYPGHLCSADLQKPAPIERKLFGRRVSADDMSMEERWALDAQMRQAALAKGFDSIVLMTQKAFSEFKASGKIPRSLELNILNVFWMAGNGRWAALFEGWPFCAPHFRPDSCACLRSASMAFMLRRLLDADIVAVRTGIAKE